MTETVTAAHLALAGELADAAGAIIRRYFRQPIAIDDKSDLTPVTIADREAEAAMRRLIEARFPDHGIFGEEEGRTRPDAEYQWVLDPIDGTKSFISGVPLFGTLIALTCRQRPVLGIIDQPVAGERWIGASGHPSTLNGREIRTRPCTELGRATLFTTAPELFKGAEAEAFQRLRAASKLTRYGTDCYAYALVATGFIDLVVESGLKPYDFCALIPVIEGAGGSVTDWQGRPLDLASDGHAVAAGDARLAAAARALLAGA
jgi:inositol-phosphate phosphatase/L-galactose 1-phosphate phosphatase/histidinol-phosphatase